MENFIETIKTLPNHLYKNRYFLKSELDEFYSTLILDYKSKSYNIYNIHIVDWTEPTEKNIRIYICINDDCISLIEAPKLIQEIINNLANYFNILGFPVRIMN